MFFVNPVYTEQNMGPLISNEFIAPQKHMDFYLQKCSHLYCSLHPFEGFQKVKNLPVIWITSR